MGGMIKTKAWFDDRGGEYATVLAWGKVQKKPRIAYSKMPEVKFLLNWHTKSDHIICRSWGNNDTSRVMASLSRGDLVLVVGTYFSTRFVNKFGEDKLMYGIKVEMCIPMELLGLTLQLYSNKEIQRMMFGDEPPDVFESDGDYKPRADDMPELEIPVF